MTLRLILPDVTYSESFRESLLEASEVGEVVPWDPEFDCSDAELTRRIILMTQGEWEPVSETRPPIPSSHFWWVDENELIGRISLRHKLVGEFGESHGHIGYGVRPKFRGQGHATKMLHATLHKAADLGITSALITCDADNAASRKVIENCGGILRDHYRNEVLRFDVPTHHQSA
jgi:predicted acetyltransferase